MLRQVKLTNRALERLIAFGTIGLRLQPVAVYGHTITQCREQSCCLIVMAGLAIDEIPDDDRLSHAWTAREIN